MGFDGLTTGARRRRSGHPELVAPFNLVVVNIEGVVAELVGDAGDAWMFRYSVEISIHIGLEAILVLVAPQCIKNGVPLRQRDKVQ